MSTYYCYIQLNKTNDHEILYGSHEYEDRFCLFLVWRSLFTLCD